MAKQKDTTGFKEILLELKKGEIRPLYVLEGDEEYLKEKLVRALETLLVEPSTKALDYVTFDFTGSSSRVNLPQIQNEVRTPPFLSKKRLIVVKNSNLFSMTGKGKKEAAQETEETPATGIDETDDGAGSSESALSTSASLSSKDRQKQLITLFSTDMGTCCLVFVEEKTDKRMKAVIEKINETGILANIAKPDIREIRTWVKGEFSKKNITINPDDCDFFIERNDGNLQNMTGEIAKLELYAQSQKKNTVDQRDIEAIGVSDLKGNIFDIVDALSKNNAQEAYRVLDLLLVQKQPVPMISFMLARHIRQLITAKDLGSTDAIIKKMKVIPFVANKLFYQAKNFSFEALEDLYKECYETDLAVKTSQIPDRMALETLFASTVHKIKKMH